MASSWKWSTQYHGWRTEISLPGLGAWRCLWNVFPGSVDGPYEAEEEADRTLDVLAELHEEGPHRDEPSAAQTTALARLVVDEAILEPALTQYLFDAMREGRLGYVIPEPGDAENDEELRLFERLHRPEAMREMVRLNEIEIHDDEEDGLAHVVLCFESAFDAEHGLSVCIHGTQVLSHGGMGDRGGWPPPSEEELAEMAAMFGRPDPRDERRLFQQTLESALADPVNGEGIRELTRAALALVDDPNQQLEITVQIDTPPVTRIEKVYYGQAGTLSLDLTIGVGLDCVIHKDSDSPRQAALQGAPWPLSLFAAQCMWPAARPRWETIKVRRIDKAASMRKAKPTGPELPELYAAAEAALREGFDPVRLAERGWRLPPDPHAFPEEGDPTPQEQALGAGVAQGLQALRGMLTGDPTAPEPPNLAALLAGASGVPGQLGLFAGMMAECDLIPVPADVWAWSDEERGLGAETALTRAGLQLVGHFQVAVPFAPMFVAYVDPRRGFYALVCDDLYQSSITLECQSLYDDGTVYEVTTRPASVASPQPPWRRVELLDANTEASEVLKQFLDRRPAEGIRPVSGDRFEEDFQEVWRRETQWRANPSGTN